VALFWQRKIHTARAAEVAPYTAHLTITENRVMPDGSSWNDVSTEVHARDRQGRIYVKTEHGSFIVQDPVKLETVTWSPNSRTAVVGHWPYWSGRKGCWADEHGQIHDRFPSDEDWHKIPASTGDGKPETIGSIGAGTSDKRIKTRFVSENLGHKEIDGLDAYGTRQTITPLEDGGPNALPETTTELWKSRDLNLKLLQVTSGPKYGSERLELSDLQRGDPDPALFEPPKGYKVESVTYRQVPCEQQ
jgi:hypothetical protein